MNIEAWIALAGLGFTLIGAIIAVVSRFVRVEAKLENHEHEETKCIPEIAVRLKDIDDRIKEDREKNSAQHQEFYEFRRLTEPMQAEIMQQLTGIIQTQERILDKLDEMERRIKP